MIVTHLSLTDFRNYQEAEVDLVAGPNLFVGSNGQGKTNLVEAIGYLSTLGSHRVATDQALIRAGQDAAIVRARLEHAGRSVLVEVQLNRSSANRAQVNRVAAKPRDLPRYAPSVLFAPEDLALVRGDPGGRRRYLDQLLVLLSPRLAGVLGDYDRVLRQRTTLLKSVRAARVAESQLSTLEVWDERLAALGSEIIVERSALIDRIRPHVADAYRRIAGDDHVADLGARLSILGDAGSAGDDDTEDAGAATTALAPTEVREAFTAALARVRRQELDRGLTLVGPHRDDLVLTLNGLPAKGYASHGESWSFALALKLAAAATLRADSPLGDPVVILDDVFAELDQIRRGRLAGAIADYEQVLITAAVLDDVPDALRAHTVRIQAGRIVEPGEDA
ncbi:DNA replication/repair protein RecF [Pseudolysinimonas yzui]|uniref:DNA replication/repair protein RecF n=1 Tax=Pseudolysinimonas yzui TaxID=2708254 RepID=UPI00174966E9|nr:DNA replication/repair protein RecF [Pseudolysinimonas yzui]